MLTSKLQRVFAVLVMAVMVLTVLQPNIATARGNDPAPAKAAVSGTAQAAVRHDTSPTALRNVPVLNATGTKPDKLPYDMQFNLTREVVDRSTIKLDAALTAKLGNKKYIDVPMPGLDVGLNGANQGTNRTVNGYGVLPPDTNGDISADHYIQTVNNVYTIWDLHRTNPNTGLPLAVYGPARMSDIFAGLSGDPENPSACEIWDDGDPIVLYDHLADRWMMSQFALANYPYPPFSECIAVSATSDPLGTWYRYEFQFDVMNDYPHFGVWPDGYYMSINQFDPSTSPAWRGQGAVVFERDLMLTGGDARMIYVDTMDACVIGDEIECYLGGMLPSELDGPIPPAGEPNYFVQFDDDAWGYSGDQLQVWSFTTDWAAGTGTFAWDSDLAVAAFDSEVCAGYARNCIPQPGTAQGLDAIADRLMYRLQYRNFGTYQTLVTNHTVDVNDVAGHAGVRWYELRKIAGDWGVHQEGTYAPDASHRWMASAAMDGSGNIAVGYSVSDGVSVYPGMRYAGRFASDPLGTLPQGETTMISGTGSQTHTAARWGDYSSLSVSPVDDCQFWFTSEWNRVNSSAEWYTYIGAFTFPEPSSLTGTGCRPHSPYSDVDELDWFAPYVYRLTDLGVTAGCGNGMFCPDALMTRAQMAIWILRTKHGGNYMPPLASGIFADVSVDSFAADWIEQLYNEGITSGCSASPLNYCPNDNILRQQMAVFLVRAKYGAAYVPPAAVGLFDDVPVGSFYAPYIEQLANDGITTGCGANNFCPNGNVTRAEMAAFLIRTFGNP